MKYLELLLNDGDKFILIENRLGHLLLIRAESVYFQSEDDVNAVKERLTQEQRNLLLNGFEVVVPHSEVTPLADYFDN